MKLIILHYHLRPGGIRRIIELATQLLVKQFNGKIDRVVLAVGENPDTKWEAVFRRRLGSMPVELFVEPAFNYLSEQKNSAAQVRKKIRAALAKLLAGANAEDTLIWAHNLGIARNLLLTREVGQVCRDKRLTLVSHHHDWWLDNRWLRWPEMRKAGFPTLGAVAQAIFPSVPSIRHVTINRSDAAHLQRGKSGSSGWLPNLTERGALPAPARVRTARKWLDGKLNEINTPVWILPCRLLRRKNVAEALLLTRWLRPEAWLVTTGGASSQDEQPYFERLVSAAQKNGWRLRLGILQGDETGKPEVAELLAASETVLLTSIQEGFGLPFLEAAAARRPLIARSIPNIAPDLEAFGFRFPQYYDEILIDPRLFDCRAERERQTRLFQTWQEQLPRPVRRYVGRPILLEARGRASAVPLSRLTLTAQLEVLAQPAGYSWELCAPHNPFLALWRKRAAAGRLQIASWPKRADDWLSGPAYARRFAEIVSRPPGRVISRANGLKIQNEFLRSKLDGRNLFPLLWATHT